MSDTMSTPKDEIKTTENTPTPIIAPTTTVSGLNRENMKPVSARGIVPVGRREAVPLVGGDQLHALKPLFFKDQTKRAQYETAIPDEQKSVAELQTQVTDQDKKKAVILTKAANEEKERTKDAGETPSSSQTQSQVLKKEEKEVEKALAKSESQTHVTSDHEKTEAKLSKVAQEEKDRTEDAGETPSGPQIQTQVTLE